MKRNPKPLPDRGDPAHDPHLPHTTRYQKRDIEHLIPPEANAVIEQQWPEVIRTFQQYDEGAGMLMLFGLVRDACKAAKWPDTMAYQMRDYLLTKLNAEKVKTYTGSDDRPGDWKVFNMKESAEQIVDRLLEYGLPNTPTSADLKIENHGSIVLVRPLTDAGKEGLRRTAPEDAQFMGDAMAVEPRYVEGVTDAAQEDGLTVS
jgi:hypothetical protein